MTFYFIGVFIAAVLTLFLVVKEGQRKPELVFELSDVVYLLIGCLLSWLWVYILAMAYHKSW